MNKLQLIDVKADFPRLVREFTPVVYNTCYHLLKNRESAEDLTQDVFLQAVQSWSGFRGESDVRTWLNRIAFNLCLNHIRDRKRRKRFSSMSPLPEDGSGEKLDGTEEAGTDPEAQIDAVERRRLLNRAVASLPENQRMTVLLQKYCGFSRNEVAAVIGKSVPAVEALLNRAKINLRRFLADSLLHGESHSEDNEVSS